MPRTQKIKDEQPRPQVTEKGLSQILEGNADNPAMKMTTGGYLETTYDRNPTNQAPALLVNSPEFAGGLTSFQAIQSEAANGLENEEQSIDAAEELFNGTQFPSGYNRSSYARQISRLPKNVLAGASEEAMKLVLAPKNAFSGMVQTAYENGWQNALADAYAEDETLKPKMESLYYTMRGGKTAIALNNMTQHDISISKLDNWKNADGSDLTDKQKQLMTQYIKLNQKRGADERRRLTMSAFGQEMQDKVYGNVETLGDVEAGPGKYGNMVGSIATSALVFGYGGTALNAAGRGLARFVAGNTARMAKFGGRSFLKWSLEHPMKAEAFEFATRSARPLSYAMSAINGERFVFGLSFSRQYDEIRSQALAAGWSPTDAHSIAFAAGMAEAGLEVPTFRTFTRYLKSTPSFRNLLLLEVMPEGFQEGAQTLSENVITNAYGLTDKQFSDIASEVLLSMMMGGLGGLAMGSIHYKAVQTEAAHEKFITALSDAYKKGAIDPLKRSNPFQDGNNFSTANKTEFTPEQTKALTVKAKNSDVQAIADNNKPTETAAFRGEDENGNLVYQLGYLSDQQTGETVGAYGVTINAQGEQVGQWERQIAPDRVADAERAMTEAKYIEQQLNAYKGYYESRLKAANPKATKEQIDRGWKQIERLVTHERETGEFRASIEASINQMLSVIDNQDRRLQRNIKELNKVLDGEIVGEKLAAFTSSDVVVRHEAQWDYVEDRITKLFRANGMEKQGKIVAKAFRNAFQDAILFDSNIDPMDFYDSVKPKILSLARARRNGQVINGAESVLDGVISKSRMPADQARSNAEHLIEQLEIYSSSESSEEQKEAAQLTVQQMLFGQTSADVNMDELYDALRSEADIEGTLAHAMSLDLGSDLNYTNYLAMAIMRNQGLSQEKINEAFGLQQANPDERYRKALQMIGMNPLSKSEIESIERMMATDEELTKEEMAEIEGLYNQAVNEIVVFDKNRFTGVHEGMHWVFDVINQIATDQSFAVNVRNTITNLTGSNRVRLPVSTMTRLNDSLREHIAQRWGKDVLITPRMMEETLVDTFFKYLEDGDVSAELSTAYNDLINNANAAYTPSPDSLLANGALSAHRQKGLMGAMRNMMEPSAPQRIAKAAKNLEGAIYSAKSKDELAVAMIDAVNEAGGVIPFNMEAPLVATRMAGDKAVEVLQMAEYAQRLADNMYQHSLALAFNNTEMKLQPDLRTGKINASDNPAAFSKTDYGVEGIVLYSRKGEPIKPKLAMQTADATLRAKATLKIANMDSLKKSVNRIGESIATAARKLGNPMSAVVQQSGYDNAQRIVYADDLLYAVKDLIRTTNEKAEREEGKYITEEMYKVCREYMLNDNRADAIAWCDTAFTNKKDAERMKALMTAFFSSVDWSYAKMTELGVNLAKRNDTYIPRSVMDKEGLLQAIHRPTEGTKLDKMIRQMKKDGKTEADIVNEINKLFRKNKGEAETEMFHHRALYSVSTELVDYYKDPFEVMNDYLKSASATIMMRELTGDLKIAKDTGKVEWGKSGRVGSMLLAYQQGKMGDYNVKAFDNFVERMQQLQKMNDTDEDFWAFIKNTQGLFALNSVTSTVTQLYELVPALYRFGMGDVAQAMADTIGHKQAVELWQAGIGEGINEFQRLDDVGYWRQMQDLLLTATGFKKMDKFMKTVVLNAIFNNAKRTLGNPEASAEAMEALDESLEEVFPKQMYGEAKLNKIKQDIMNNNITDEVGAWLRSQILKTQPIDSIAAPANFVASGSLGKAMYFLGTTQLTQANYLVGDMIKTYQRKGTAALAKKIARFLIFATMVGVPTSMLIDLLCLRKPDLGNAAVYSPLQFFFVNEYLVARAKRDGVASAVLNQFAPGWAVADRVSKGQFAKLVPVLPQAAYNLTDKGQKQLNRFNENLLPKAEVDLDFDADIKWFGEQQWS